MNTNTPPNENQNDREQKATELLVIRCQLGEPEAFDLLVERWHETLWRYVASMVSEPDAVAEILQDGWLRILQGISRLENPSRLRPWLFSIVRRAFLDRLRGQYRQPDVEPLDEEPPSPRVEDFLAFEDLTHLREALATLPPDDRETVALFYLRELELKEVASVLDVPVGTVKSRLHRARRQLKQHLQTRGAS